MNRKIKEHPHRSKLMGIWFILMSIFIADLGFVDSPDNLLMAKTGILLASAVAGFGGYFWLKLNTNP